MKRSVIFILVAVAASLAMVGCGCAAPAPASSPSWQQLQSAKIPSQCGHQPTKLVKGKHTKILKGWGFFEFVGTLYSGKPGYVTKVSSSAGPLTAVVVDCNQGGVPWSHQILFFSAGPKFVASTDLYDQPSEAIWSRAGLNGPGRNGVQSMSTTRDGLKLNVLAYGANDASCCPSRRADVTVKVSGGKATVTKVTPR